MMHYVASHDSPYPYGCAAVSPPERLPRAPHTPHTLGAPSAGVAVVIVSPEPLSMFDHVFAEPHAQVHREREEMAAYLASFVDDPSWGSA